MSSNGKPFTTVTLEDGTFAVVRTDPRKPQFLEVIAIFSDVSRARDYADTENQHASDSSRSIAHQLPEARQGRAIHEGAAGA